MTIQDSDPSLRALGPIIPVTLGLESFDVDLSLPSDELSAVLAERYDSLPVFDNETGLTEQELLDHLRESRVFRLSEDPSEAGVSLNGILTALGDRRREIKIHVHAMEMDGDIDKISILGIVVDSNRAIQQT